MSVQRNFHIFHYVTEGTSGPERDALHLGDAHEYRYLSQNATFNIPGVDDQACDVHVLRCQQC